MTNRLAKLVLVALFLCFAREGYAQEHFRFSKPPKELPIVYLERLKVRNPSRQLSVAKRHELCRFFVEAYVVAKREWYSDDLLNPDAPIYRLFQANFPDVAQREGEGGIFLYQIVHFINTLTEYRVDVDQVLRASFSDKMKCKPLD